MAFDMFSPQASRSAKFENPGDTVSGEIMEIGEPVQQKEFGTDRIAFWNDGSPKMQVKITLQTQERNPGDETDDGKRNLWVSESGKKGGMLASIRDAVRNAGADTIRPGGWLQMTFTGHDPESQNPKNPRKMYQAAYEAPAPAGGMFGNAQTPQPQAPQQYQQPTQAPQAQQQGWAGDQQNASGNYADPTQYQQPAQPAPAPQQYQQPHTPAPATPAQQGITPDIAENIRALIGMNIDTNTIVQSIANPAVTHQLVDSMRTA